MPGQNPIFVPGSTNIPDAVRHAIDVPMEDMRAPDFPDFTLPLFADLKKVFMLPADLAIVAVSDKALAAGESAKLPCCYFSFDGMLATNRQEYFPYTPAISLMRGLRASGDLLLTVCPPRMRCKAKQVPGD